MLSTHSPRKRFFAVSTALLVAGLVVVAAPRVASASVSWSAANPALPSNAVPGQGVTLTSTSCPVDGWCVAVGDYAATNGVVNYEAAVILTESGGNWNATQAPLPAAAVAAGQSLLTSVQCAVVGSCVAVGGYLDTTGATQALTEQLSSGSWTAGTLPLPAGASTSGTSTFAQLQGISCPTASWCIASGVYTLSNGAEQSLLAGDFSGAWVGVAGVVPGASTGSEFLSIACPAVGSCVVPGTYEVGGSFLPMVDTYNAPGGWTATALPLPSGTSPAASVMNNDLDVSCPAVGTCVVAGTTFDGNYEGLLDTLSGGSWTATAAALPAGPSPDVQLDAVSCGGPSTCVAVGLVTVAGVEQGLIDSLAGGTWSATTAPTPAGTPANADVNLHDVNCPATGSCVAEGQTDATGVVNGIFLNLAGGSWTAMPAPLPSDAATSSDPAFAPMTCPGAGVCLAVGTYLGSSGREGVIETDPSLAASVTTPSATVASAQSVTYSAAVTGPAQPTGSVTFSSGLVALCSAPLVSGTATCTGPVPSTSQVLASYSGDGASNPSWGTTTNPAPVPPTTVVDVTPALVAAKVSSFFPSRPSVEVLNSAGKPVAGVVVTFSLPTSGASAYAWGTMTVTTNAAGVAETPYLSANSQAGVYLLWAQTNSAPAKTGFILGNVAS